MLLVFNSTCHFYVISTSGLVYIHEHFTDIDQHRFIDSGKYPVKGSFTFISSCMFSCTIAVVHVITKTFSCSLYDMKKNKIIYFLIAKNLSNRTGEVQTKDVTKQKTTVFQKHIFYAHIADENM